MQVIGIIGLGLMGGSLGLAVQKYISDIRVIGYDKNPENIDYALKNGIIDEKLTEKNLKNAEILFIAVPVKSIIKVLNKIKSELNTEKTLVTDMGSTKEYIYKEISNKFPDIKYIGGHPVAGREVSGPQGAVADLFKNNNYVLLKNSKKNLTEDMDKLRSFLTTLGCKVSFLEPKVHDQLLAFSSHQPQIMATILVNQLKDFEKVYPDISHFIGTGFMDMSRLAASDPTMWVDIFLTNRENIIERINDHITLLKNFKEALIEQDDILLNEFMKMGKEKRMDLIKEKNNETKDNSC